MAVITIIGIGQIGSALAFCAGENGNLVRMVGTHVDKDVVEVCKRDGKHPKFDTPYPSGTEFYYCEQWQQAVNGADFVIGAISSFGVDWFLEEILKNIDPAMPVLSATKGLADMGDGKLSSYPDYWVRCLRKCGIRRDIYALGGPGTAMGIMHHDHTQVVICGKNTKILKMMKEALQTSWFHISLTKDARGLETAVAIKNAYAMAVAMALGYARKNSPYKEDDAHVNSQAAVFTQAVKEMLKVLDLQKADLDSALIGIGDLYVTSTGGRSRMLGLLLGEGNTIDQAQAMLGDMTFESLVVIRRLANSISIMAKKGKVNLEDFPLMNFVLEVLDNGKMEEIPWDRFTFENI